MSHDIGDTAVFVGVSKGRLVITAVVGEGRPVAQVAADQVSQQWIYKLVARYRAEGDQAFEPRPAGRTASRRRLQRPPSS